MRAPSARQRRKPAAVGRGGGVRAANLAGADAPRARDRRDAMDADDDHAHERGHRAVIRRRQRLLLPAAHREQRKPVWRGGGETRSGVNCVTLTKSRAPKVQSAAGLPHHGKRAVTAGCRPSQPRSTCGTSAPRMEGAARQRRRQLPLDPPPSRQNRQPERRLRPLHAGNR